MITVPMFPKSFQRHLRHAVAVLTILAVGTSVQAGWPKVGGVLGQAGKNVSNGWKQGPGAAWNRGVRDPWQEHVARPFFVENPWVRGGQRAMSEEQAAAQKWEEQKRQRLAEARQLWNAQFRTFEFQVRQFAESHAGQFVSRQDLEQFIAQQRQRWLQANPFPAE